jgi:hypothetical protein
MGAPDQGIPQDLLNRAEAIMVFPGVKKAAFIVGGSGGQGVVSRRTSGGWSEPAFLNLGGGSIGAQIGASSTDYVLLIMNQEGLKGILEDKFEMGGEASVAAGPVGRTAAATTNATLDAGILSYSRTKGAFAGVALKGAVIELQRAYDDLLSELQSLLFKAFNFGEGEARERIRTRAKALIDHCVEPRLKAFALQLQDDYENEAAWIEAVATIVVGKEPRLWNDTDRARYEVTLADLVRNFRHIEALVFEESARLEQGRKPEHILRISVSDRHSKDLEAVVVVEPQDSSKYGEAVVRLDELLEQLNLAGNPELALAALSSVSQKYLSELINSAGKKSKIESADAGKKVKSGK